MATIKAALLASIVFSMATPVFAQQALMAGSVKDENGAPVEGATVAFVRYQNNSMRLEVKTDKKGNFTRSNIQAGLYNFYVEVNGKQRAQVNFFTMATGTNREFDVKLAPESAPPVIYDCNQDSVSCIIFSIRKQKLVSAAGPNIALPPPPPVAKGASKEEKENAKKLEDQEAQRALLNSTYAAAKIALANKEFDKAVEGFTKASTMETRQPLIWMGLGDSYAGLAGKGPSDERKENYASASDAYKKAIALTPDDAVLYNNYAVILASASKLDEAKVSLAKAIELDPPHAGQFHFNMAAILTNSGQIDPAIEEFKLSLAADPNNATVHYEYGVALFGKGTVNAAGKMIAPAGTAEELQKYLELQPDGPNAQAAKELITAMGATVSTNYKNPAAPKAPAPKKGK